MVDPGTAALVAAATALFVGLLGVFASLVQSSRTARATIAAELNGRQVDALASVLRIVEVQGRAVQDQIFNLTEAESGDKDYYEPGPARRPIIKPKGTAYAEAAALVAAYGDVRVQEAFLAWSTAIEAWDNRYQQLAWDWSPGDLTRPEHVAVEREAERHARSELGRVVNETLLSLRKLR